MIDFEVKLSDDQKVALYLTNLGQKIDEDDLAMQAAAIMLDRTRKRFLDAVNPEGRAWPVSEASKRRPTKTLYATGSLFNSLTLARTGQGSYKVFVDPNTTNRDTNENVSEYAKDIQQGLNGQPERRFLGVSDTDRKEVAEIVFGRLVAKLKQ
jgi:phage gpG-like protein